MKPVLLAFALLGAAQMAAAGSVYNAPAVYHAPMPTSHVTYVPEVTIVPKTITEVCLAKQTPIFEPVAYVCPHGYTPDQSGKCAAQNCHQPKPEWHPKPVYTHPVPVQPVYGRKLQGASVSATAYSSASASVGKVAYHPQKVAYHPQPVYVHPKPQYVPKVPQAPVCTVVYANPVPVCKSGKPTNGQCLVGYAPGVCPPGAVSPTPDAHGLCTFTRVIQQQVVTKKAVVVQKPQYKPPVYASGPGPVYGRRLNGLAEDIGNMAKGFFDKIKDKKEQKKVYKPVPYHPAPAPKYPLCHYP